MGFREIKRKYLRVIVHTNLQPGLGQRFNNAFCCLLSFLRIDLLLRTIFEAFANCSRNYRNHLMLINHVARLRAVHIILHAIAERRLINCCRSVGQNEMARPPGSGRSIQYLNSGIALS
jgi:hypothetical protein